MTDPTKPFIGFPNAPKPKKGFRKVYADTWLDDFLRGLLGDTEPSGGTVLDPDDKARRNRVKDIGEQAGILTSIPQQILGLGALPLLGGAIRKGGAKDLVQMHGTRRDNLPKIAESGFLKSPSIGITSRRANDYSSGVPQFIFAAGKADPANVPGTLTNRDGYTYNPYNSSTKNPAAFQDELEYQLKELNRLYGVDDLRLGQYWPGLSQGFSIAASPKFRSYADFEKSPGGAATLRVPESRQDPYWRGITRDLGENAEVMGVSSPENYAKSLVKRALTKGPDHLTGFEGQLWERASRAPSAMAEMKVHGDLPINPKDTALFLPDWAQDETLRLAEPFRDAGFKIFNPFNLARDFRDDPSLYYKYGKSPNSEAIYAKRLPLVADPRGGFNLPADLTLRPGDTDVKIARDTWNDFITGGKAGGSPPLSKAPKFSDDVKETWINFAKDPKEAEKNLEHNWKMGFLTETEYNEGVAFIDKKWPVKPLGAESQSLADMFGMKPVGPPLKGAPPLPKTDWGIQPPEAIAAASQIAKDPKKFVDDLYQDGQIDLVTYGQVFELLKKGSNWAPAKPAPHAEQIPFEPLPDLLAPGLLKPNTPGQMGELNGMLPDANLQLDEFSKIKYDTLMETADEYPLTMEELLAKIGPMSPKAQSEAVKTMWEAYMSNLHKSPNWHKLLEDKLKDTLMMMPEADLPNQSFIKLLNLK